MTRVFKLPRWVQVRFPRGAMFGEPGKRDKQRAVLADTLRALETLDAPGGHVELPYRWEAAGIAWRGQVLTDAQSR